MSIFRRISFLGFALVSLVVLAACGGDGDGGDGAFELPPPGEYSFDVTGTIEIETVREQVSAGPVTRQETETGNVSGDLTIQLGEDGKFTIKDKEGVDLVVGDLEGGPVHFTQNEEMPSTGTISEDGMTIELNVVAELATGETTTNEEPIRVEGDGNPLSDEGATLTTPADAEPVRFAYGPEDEDTRAGFFILFVVALIEQEQRVTEVQEPPPGDDADLPTDTEEQEGAFSDAEGDEYECDSSEGVDDAAVDILSVSVTQLLDGVEVRVTLGQSPLESAKDFSFSVQVQTGQGELYKNGTYEVHDGEPNNLGDVTATDKEVTFFFPDLVLKEGDTVAARSFHLEKDGDPVHCDVTDAFPLDELILIPCGGECTREE